MPIVGLALVNQVRCGMKRDDCTPASPPSCWRHSSGLAAAADELAKHTTVTPIYHVQS